MPFLFLCHRNRHFYPSINPCNLYYTVQPNNARPHRQAARLTASDGPASPTIVHIASFRDDGNLTHVFLDDGGVFGSNLISAATGTALWPTVPAANDAPYFISTDIAFKHVYLALAQAGDQNWDLVREYYNGADYNTALTLGTDYTIFKQGGGGLTTLDDLFAALLED